MDVTTTQILDTKYFSPAFNTAIFDGAVKLYFTQSQETEALRVYFKLQSHFKNLNPTSQTPNTTFTKLLDKKTIFIMLYPNKESFLQSFDLDQDLVIEKVGSDVVIGIQSPVSENLQDKVLSNIEFILGERDFV